MAIGARITSTNLSGKTATVTFVPVSGSTSGSTENLGSKTIPFNNINTHPYGVYSLYFAEYDYTYTLNVPEPYGTNQSFQFISTIDGGNGTWASANLTFDDLTAEVIDYGISTSDWYMNDHYFVNESGYMLVLNGQNDYQDKLVLFTDYRGNLIEQYSGNTNNYDYDIVEGKYTYHAWEDLGVLKYSDGVNVYTFNWSSGTGSGEFNNFDIEWDYDGAMGNGNFVFSLRNSNSGDYQYYLAEKGTHTLITTTNTTMAYKWFSYVNDGDFMVNFERAVGSDIYGDLKVYSSTGTLVRTISLPNSYNNSSYGFFGDNQFFAYFWDYNDTNVDYYIIRYNYNTDTVNTTTHTRGSNYSNQSTQYWGGFWPENSGDKSSWVAMFYTSVNSSSLSGYTFTYLDFVYTLDNNETFYTATYQNSGNDDKSMYMWFWGGQKRPTTFGNTGDGNISTIQLTPSGLTYNILGPITSYWNDWSNIYYFGDRMALDLRDVNDGNIATVYAISSGNTTLDTVSYTTSSYPWNFTSRSEYGVFYITDYTNGYLLTEDMTEFASTATAYRYSYNDYSSGERQTRGMLLYENDTYKARFVERGATHNEITLPQNNGDWNIQVGRDRFLYVYCDTDNGSVHINLYDFDGELKNTLHTSYYGWWNVYATKDRYVVVINNNNTYICHLISDDVIATATLSDYDSYDELNDFIWWDN